MDVHDPDYAAQRVYTDYLTEHYRDDRQEGWRRAVHFENTGEPHADDLKAFNRARDASSQSTDTNEALSTARDAFYGEKFREDFLQKNAHPTHFANDVSYHERLSKAADEHAEQKVSEFNERRTQRSEQLHSNADAPQGAIDGTAQELIEYAKKGQTTEEGGVSSGDELVQYAQNSGKATQADDTSSAQELMDYARGVRPPSGPEVPSERSPRNQFNRYDELKGLPSNTPRFHR